MLIVGRIICVGFLGVATCKREGTILSILFRVLLIIERVIHLATIERLRPEIS